MWMSIVLTTASLLAGPPQDTIVPVERGVRLDVENQRGQVTIAAWDRDEVSVEGDGRLVLRRAGAVLRVRPDRTRGMREVDMRIRVPAWMVVRAGGNQVDVTVSGTRAAITAETVHGDIGVDGGGDLVSLRTVQGEVRARNSTGRLEVVSVNDDVAVTGVRGDVTIEATNGDIVMRDMASAAVQASTVNGDVEYTGTIADDGRYSLTTHNGDIILATPASANATVEVVTVQGDFESAFPVRMAGGSRDRQFEFTLGTGSARVRVESFNGSIRIRRP
ncbi:MAG TPA: DUF4097 family beta strand repeat-containing protein [Longimicrobiales bacterium]|nr:DUF4097 family beta strand repeat-containing protein [Longimicrobiales bacterium]